MITKDILDVLPGAIRTIVLNYKDNSSIQELRLKIDKPLIFVSNNKENRTSYITKAEDIRMIIQKISSFSIYAFEEEIRQGFITIQGGHRVGICGSCVLDKGNVKTIKYISSINIRVAKDIKGCGDKVIPYVLNGDTIHNTILISPPKCGKTTILRDIARQLSDGISSYRFTGKNVAVIDERSEIAACFRGVPQMEVGMRTDVLDNCPKSEGIIMAIRSMAPSIIVCDEIGTEKDMESIVLALNSGVKLVTTIHGFDEKDLYSRPVFSEIIDNKVFDRAVILSNKNGVGTIEYIYDFRKNQIMGGISR